MVLVQFSLDIVEELVAPLGANIVNDLNLIRETYNQLNQLHTCFVAGQTKDIVESSSSLCA